jgi:hypothetical protein
MLLDPAYWNAGSLKHKMIDLEGTFVAELLQLGETATLLITG